MILSDSLTSYCAYAATGLALAFASPSHAAEDRYSVRFCTPDSGATGSAYTIWQTEYGATVYPGRHLATWSDGFFFWTDEGVAFTLGDTQLVAIQEGDVTAIPCFDVTSPVQLFVTHLFKDDPALLSNLANKELQMQLADTKEQLANLQGVMSVDRADATEKLRALEVSAKEAASGAKLSADAMRREIAGLKASLSAAKALNPSGRFETDDECAAMVSDWAKGRTAAIKEKYGADALSVINNCIAKRKN